MTHGHDLTHVHGHDDVHVQGHDHGHDYGGWASHPYVYGAHYGDGYGDGYHGDHHWDDYGHGYSHYGMPAHVHLHHHHTFAPYHDELRYPSYELPVHGSVVSEREAKKIGIFVIRLTILLLTGMDLHTQTFFGMDNIYLTTATDFNMLLLGLYDEAYLKKLGIWEDARGWGGSQG